MCPGVDSASKNEYQDIPSVMKFGSFNLLDRSRPRRPVTGIPYIHLYRNVNGRNETIWGHGWNKLFIIFSHAVAKIHNWNVQSCALMDIEKTVKSQCLDLGRIYEAKFPSNNSIYIVSKWTYLGTYTLVILDTLIWAHWPLNVLIMYQKLNFNELSWWCLPINMIEVINIVYGVRLKNS